MISQTRPKEVYEFFAYSGISLEDFVLDRDAKKTNLSNEKKSEYIKNVKNLFWKIESGSEKSITYDDYLGLFKRHVSEIKEYYEEYLFSVANVLNQKSNEVISTESAANKIWGRLRNWYQGFGFATDAEWGRLQADKLLLFAEETSKKKSVRESANKNLYNQYKTSEKIFRLWNAAQTEKDSSVFKEEWRETSLKEKHKFICLLEEDSSELATKIKHNIAPLIYRRAFSRVNEISCPLEEERTIFYHVTDIKGIEGILKSGKIEVSHQQLFRGAFVSTYPEARFGKYALVLRNIEWLNPVNTGFLYSQTSYWVGFGEAIPVNENTLIRVGSLEESDEKELEELRKNCAAWANRNIKVQRDYVENFNVYDSLIPSDWPKSI
ncbi:MAG: hypothetical protein Tsb0021_10130 [Chlamydiales bacterium]